MCVIKREPIWLYLIIYLFQTETNLVIPNKITFSNGNQFGAWVWSSGTNSVPAHQRTLHKFSNVAYIILNLMYAILLLDFFPLPHSLHTLFLFVRLFVSVHRLITWSQLYFKFGWFKVQSAKDAHWQYYHIQCYITDPTN
jgi:hypothetical protein